MDLSKKATEFAQDRIKDFKEGIAMAPVLIWLVLSRIVFFTVAAFFLNVVLLLVFFFTRDNSIPWYLILIAVNISIGAILLTFWLARGYGIECAIEHVWNKKKHVFYDIVANKATQFLVNRKMPLTSENTWKWLSEKPQSFLNSLPFILRMIVSYFFNQIPFAPLFGKMIQHKAQLSDDPQQTALVLSRELQTSVNPEIVQSSVLKLILLFALNILLFVGLSFLFP